MRMKSLHVVGLITLAAAALNGQSTNQPVYWSTSPPNCSSLNETPIPIADATGTTTIGYSCFVSGTFVWLAAGGIWSTAIRVAAPASGAVGVAYSFTDQQANKLSLDTTGSIQASGYDVGFALFANQPAEIDLLGATSDSSTGYSNTATGSVYVAILCPDATTCSKVLPQLLYSALPTYPWSLSVPIAWDYALSTQWSAVGIEDGGAHRVSLVVDNEDVTNISYNVHVYDHTGALVGSGTTPLIPPGQNVGNGVLGPGGTYGVLLSDLISTPLKADIFKILVDGGSSYSAVEMLQIDGPSATTLEVAYDVAPTSTPSPAAVRRANVSRLRTGSTPKPVLKALPM
jgi:hypothetical protein